MDDKRNLILAAVLTLAILFGWPLISERFFPTPKAPVETAQQVVGNTAKPDGTAAPDTTESDAEVAIRPLEQAIKQGPRIAIDTPRLKGSINLKGARIDDIVLPTYKQTVEKNSPPVRLFAPVNTMDSYFARFAWGGQGVKTPGFDTIWTADGSALTPKRPVTLRWDNGSGQHFLIRLSVDENYMLTVEQRVENVGTAPVSVYGIGMLSRMGPSKDISTWTIHTGPIGVFDGAANYDVNFNNLAGDEPGFLAKIFGTKAVAGVNRYESTGGWIGFTEHYWHAAIIPAQNLPVTAMFRCSQPDTDNGDIEKIRKKCADLANNRYQANVSYAPQTVAPGQSATVTSRLFVGAKETALLEHYTDAEGVTLFDRAIDWGWFRWFEKPIFYLLDWLFKAIGNFGVAIICLTFIVRGLMFPVAQRQFASMAAMRAIQPKMKAIQEKYKDDKAKSQQEILKLYQQEKVNPLSGCLPIFLQIPVFFALYKVLMLTIEMRHQPFILWIKDLSAPDPLHVLNLFGLLPFTPPSFLGIGILAIILGVTMFLQFKLNPAPMDDMQKQIFAIMPWMMMFIMAPFAAGLLIYWCTSNLLTIAQQWYLYSKHPALKQPTVKPAK